MADTGKAERGKGKAASSKKAVKTKEPARTDEAKELEILSKSVLDSAGKISDKIGAKWIFVVIDDPGSLKLLEPMAKRKELVVVLDDCRIDEDIRKIFKNLLTMPAIKLTRIGRIKLSVMRGMAANLLSQGDKIVCVTGMPGFHMLDSIVVIHIGREFEILSSSDVENLSTNVRPEVFEQLVTISVELASQGREGKPVGTIFVLGDTDKVLQLSRQMIFNPFQGYPEEERNILDPALRETIKEFAVLDGSFIIRDDGVLVTAGRHLNAALEDESLPQGLGSRHVAAAGITAVTGATAIVISESTGDVRIFRGGKVFMEIEKSA